MIAIPIAKTIDRITLLIVISMTMPVSISAQDVLEPASKTEAMQIGEVQERRGRADVDGKAHPDHPRTTPSQSRLSQAEADQIANNDRRDTPPAQISSSSTSFERVVQLSKAELEAALAQLTSTERLVLLEAIEGSDICDNPPDVAAIVALCRTRIETRSAEFAARQEDPLSAEERLLRGGIDNDGRPSLSRVIERLSRAPTVSSDNFDNQAIASVALAPPPTEPDPDTGGDALSGLPNGTEALINAIVEQLGGPPGG